jgi:two-component system, NarL family, response regulator LiaR
VADNSLERLTERQRDVLSLLCKGFSNPEIANYVGISRRTVKGYVSQLFLIYGVSNRTELAGLLGQERSAGAGE